MGKGKSIYSKLLSTIGMNSTNLRKLERMKREIEDLDYQFTNTPFYLSPLIYQENMEGHCDAKLKEDALKLCEFAISHLSDITEKVVNLLEEANSEESSIDNKELTERFGEIIGNKEVKRSIVLFLKDYSLNRQIYANAYNKKELED